MLIILRGSYLSYEAENKRLDVKDYKKLATLMRTRKDKIDYHYIKILPQDEKQEIIKKNIPEPNLKPLLSPYQKQLKNNSYIIKEIKKTLLIE